MRVGFLLALLVCAAAPAAAHPVPFSYLDLRIGADGVAGTLTVHVFDAARELSIDPPDRLLDASVASSRAAALQSLLATRLSIAAGDDPLSLAWGPIDVLPDTQSLRLPFGARPGSNGGQRRVRPPIVRLTV